MNNSKFLKIIILLLLIVNLSIISFVWFKRPQKKDAVGNFFAKELQFTNKQKEQFQALKEEHRNQIEILKESNKEKHDAYFDLLKNSNVDSVTVKNAADEIIKIEEKKELATFYHFQKIRSICDEEQKQKFDKIIKDAARMMAPQREGQRPPPSRVEEDDFSRPRQ